MSQIERCTSAERELIDSIKKRFISFGTSLHGPGLLIGLCSESAEEIAREGSISQCEVDDLVHALRERGYGKRSFTVVLHGVAHATVEATDQSEAEEIAEGMDWEEYEVEEWDVQDVIEN